MCLSQVLARCSEVPLPPLHLLPSPVPTKLHTCTQSVRPPSVFHSEHLTYPDHHPDGSPQLWTFLPFHTLGSRYGPSSPPFRAGGALAPPAPPPWPRVSSRQCLAFTGLVEVRRGRYRLDVVPSRFNELSLVGKWTSEIIFIIEVQPTRSVTLVSGVRHRDSTVLHVIQRLSREG